MGTPYTESYPRVRFAYRGAPHRSHHPRIPLFLHVIDVWQTHSPSPLKEPKSGLHLNTDHYFHFNSITVRLLVSELRTGADTQPSNTGPTHTGRSTTTHAILQDSWPMNGRTGPPSPSRARTDIGIEPEDSSSDEDGEENREERRQAQEERGDVTLDDFERFLEAQSKSKGIIRSDDLLSMRARMGSGRRGPGVSYPGGPVQERHSQLGQFGVSPGRMSGGERGVVGWVCCLVAASTAVVLYISFFPLILIDSAQKIPRNLTSSSPTSCHEERQGLSTASSRLLAPYCIQPMSTISYKLPSIPGTFLSQHPNGTVHNIRSLSIIPFPVHVSRTLYAPPVFNNFTLSTLTLSLLTDGSASTFEPTLSPVC